MGKNGNEIEWDTNGTNEQGYDLGLSRNYVYLHMPAQSLF